MRKHRLLRLMPFAIATVLAGCNPFDDFEQSPTDGKLEVQIAGNIVSTTTRANTEGFVDGDAVGLYVVNYKGDAPGELLDAGNQIDHGQYTYSLEKNQWIPMGAYYYKDDKTAVDFYGYYPYGKPDDVNSYAFEVMQDQSVASEGGSLSTYEASDFLWGKTESVLPTKEKVAIAFKHRMAGALVVLEQGTGFAEGEFDRVERSVMMTNVTRQSTIDLATGKVTAKGEAAAVGTVMSPTSDGYRAIAVPQSVAGDSPLFAITLDGVVYNFKKIEAFEYPAGAMSRFTITINKKDVTGTYELKLANLEIVPWIEDNLSHAGEARQYYVVEMNEPGTLGETLRLEKKSGAKIKNLKIKGTIDKRDFNYMRDSMTVLQAVNLKEVKIAEVTTGDGYNKNLYSANEIPNKAFGGKTSLYYVAFPDGITRIGDEAFGGYRSDGSSITGTLVIPDGVVEIGGYAFSKCKNLTSVSLPSSLKQIGNYAFGECENLSGKLSLPYGLDSIRSSAFSGCGKFSGTLVLPESLSYIGEGAFGACKGFTGGLKIPEKVTALNRTTFYACGGLRGELILHDNLTFKGEEIFAGCSFTGELVLPKGLTTIPARTFGECLFSSIAGFPEGLTEIGDYAFLNCWRLSGVLEFPKDMPSIGANAFDGCKTLEGIILPEHLSIIKGGAFNDCFYLNSIVSKSLVPPVVISGAFNGVPKDNFTVEVPDVSVNRYQAANEWSLFKRISAYRDFSINRRFTRFLNKAGDKVLYLKALEGAEWTVESKPDWITVTPTSGTGKTEVTFTAGELTKGAGMRTGQVVFKLSGTEYTQSTTVEQYNYQYGDGDLVTLQTAKKGKGVNIVILGDCYDAKDISEGNYLTDVKEAYKHMFAVEPYKTYADYFNVYTVFGLSDDSGMGTINLEKNACFGTQYFTAHGITADADKCFEYACKAPINNNLTETVVMVIPNTTEYAGITQMWGDGSSIAICPKSSDAYPYDFRGIVQHEAGGHAFAKLGDEYIYTHNWVDQCKCDNPHHGELKAGKARGWYRNLSLTSDLRTVDWSHLIFRPDYANIVDVFEGGWFHTKNVWRSEPNSCMNNNIPYFSAISRQEIVERIMRIAGETFNLDDFCAKDVRTINPATRALLPQWTQPYSNSRQYPPRYMGEKPNFKSSKR